MDTKFSKWRPHPWHGLDVGPAPPSIVTAFIEITPFDLVKYEVDKSSGYMKVDRAQRTSSLPPTIYGFVPQTYAGPNVAALMEGATRGEVLLQACVVGGLPMLDAGEADDKIIAVMRDDPIYGDMAEIEQVPGVMVDRLMHYFSTYKSGRAGKHVVSVGEPYSRTHAERVIQAAIEDYRDRFGGAER